jgi:hypothetical protein
MPEQNANVLQVLIGQMAKRSDTDFRFQQSAAHTRTCRAYRATPQSLALRRISDAPCDAPVEDYPNQRL